MKTTQQLHLTLNKNKINLRTSSIFLLVFLVSSSLCGQPKEFPGTLKIEKLEKSSADTPINKIRGRVIDSQTKEFLAGASVVIKRTVIGTSTNAEGNFYLVIPEKLLNRKIVLIISTVGYVRKEFLINKKDLKVKKNFGITKWNKQ